MFAGSVKFKIRHDFCEAFLPLITDNAKASLDNEDGCQLFDVCVDKNDRCNIFLYELYDDEAAFATHLATAYFKSFDKSVAPMVQDKQVDTYHRL